MPNLEVKVEVLKTVLAMAWSDGVLTDSEERLLDFLIDTSGLPPEQEDLVRARGPASPDLERLWAVVTDAHDRAWAYEMAALVSYMDGVRAAAESRLLARLRPVLNLDASSAAAAERRARAVYERFVASRQGAGGDEA